MLGEVWYVVLKPPTTIVATGGTSGDDPDATGKMILAAEQAAHPGQSLTVRTFLSKEGYELFLQQLRPKSIIPAWPWWLIGGGALAVIVWFLRRRAK